VSTHASNEGKRMSNKQTQAILDRKTHSKWHSRRLWKPVGVIVLALFAGIGIMAAGGWLPHTDALTGKKTGWFGEKLPGNAASSWNPFAAPLPGATPQLSKEYIYAGSRLLAVEDANAGASPTATPTATPPPSLGIEGDLSPRYAGNGIIDTTDISLERQYVAGLITPQPGFNEFQRADTSPRATLGDGQVVATDIQQVKRYAAALDPLVGAGGPVGPGGGNGPQAIQQIAGKSAAESNAQSSANRELRIGAANGRRGAAVTVPVFMKMERNETAVAFTLEYDTSILSDPRIEISNALPASAVLTVNTTQPGKIAIVIDADECLSSTPRELRIVFVTFDIPTRAGAGRTPIRITDSLSRRSVSDNRALALTTTYIDGDLTVAN